MTQIQIDWARAAETKRHDVAMEQQQSRELEETRRHNMTGEKETKRHNVYTERENARHNRAGETETHRHNVKTESQSDRQISENIRHDKMTEKLTGESNEEQRRHNKRTESQTDTKLAEERKHNRNTENLAAQDLQIKKEKTKAEMDKLSADIALTNARAYAQEFANSVDTSNPRLYTANRYYQVFSEKNQAALLYAGISGMDTTLAKVVTGVLSVDEGVRYVDAKYKAKNGVGLTSKQKQNWRHAFVESANAWTDILVGGKSTAEQPKPVR